MGRSLAEWQRGIQSISTTSKSSILVKSLVAARTLLGAPGLTTRSKKLLVTKGSATRSKDAIRLEAIAIRLEIGIESYLDTASIQE